MTGWPVRVIHWRWPGRSAHENDAPENALSPTCERNAEHPSSEAVRLRAPVDMQVGGPGRSERAGGKVASAFDLCPASPPLLRR